MGAVFDCFLWVVLGFFWGGVVFVFGVVFCLFGVVCLFVWEFLFVFLSLVTMKPQEKHDKAHGSAFSHTDIISSISHHFTFLSMVALILQVWKQDTESRVLQFVEGLMNSLIFYLFGIRRS